MKKSFFYFAWKEFVRSSSFNKNAAAKGTLIFLAIYFGAVALYWGFRLDDVLLSKYAGQDVILSFNVIVPVYLGFDLMLRLMVQNLPTFGYQPFLILPVSKHKVAGYMLRKSLFHFFNILPFIMVLPFAFSVAIGQLSMLAFVAWLVFIFCLVFTNHYLAMYLKWITNESDKAFYSLFVVAIAVSALDFFDIVNVNYSIGKLIHTVTTMPYLVVLGPLMIVAVYMLNRRYILSRFYLDEIQTKKSDTATHDFSWLNQIGDYGKMLSLEVKMILRNKRPKQSAVMSLIFILYGLIIYRDYPKNGEEFIFVVGGIFMTGIFSMTYGQFFPSWHSSYYPLLMSQNLKMKQVLQSAYFLMAMSNIVFYLLSLGYVLISPKVIYIHLVMMLYNVGVNSWIIFALGLNNRKLVNINEKASFNYQGMGATQWLMAFPLMFGPMIVYGILALVFNRIVAYSVMGGLGLIGFILHPKLINYFTKAYLRKKHLMIAGYKSS